MRSLSFFRTLGATIAALLLVAAPPVQAALTADVTYDLSDSVLAITAGFKHAPVTNADPVNGTVAGAMKVRYASNSSSGMPIQSGGATLRSFNLTLSNISLHKNEFGASPGGFLFYPVGTLRWSLTAPAYGSFTAGGALTGLAANLKLTGSLHCSYTVTGYGPICQYFAGIPTSLTVPISRSLSGTFTFLGSAGPNGGSQSTRHILTGTQSPLFVQFGQLFKLNTYGVNVGPVLIGREVLREADEHDPKVIPEPGTLLLLSAGAAGLALVGRATRRSR